MQQQDQTETNNEPEEAETAINENRQLPTPGRTNVPPQVDKAGSEFDWLAVGVVLLIAAVFALLARLNVRPATSLVPAAVLSASGCGLLVTALRKLHTPQRPGLREAALAGLLLAVLQFIAAISYPNVLFILNTASDERRGFLSTWVLIALFSVVFSMIGAALGHLSFAPLRPLPPTARASREPASIDAEIEDKEGMVRPERPWYNYIITVVLLGLVPTLIGFVFAALFDYILRSNQFFPGPYPTLRLLAALLPWQIPFQMNLNATDTNSLIFFLWQLWRVPVFLGNPTAFDVQALEPYIFNGAALALFLLHIRDVDHRRVKPALQWAFFLLLEALLGLLLVLPADLWIVRGLQGLLQDPVVVIKIRALYILDQQSFLLNLLMGPLLCVGLGLLLRWIMAKKRPRKPAA